MKEKSLEQAYAEEAAIKKALAEKYRADRIAREKQTVLWQAAEAERQAKCFNGSLVRRDENGAITVLDPDGYQCACFDTPESIETLYTELKKALNK